MRQVLENRSAQRMTGNGYIGVGPVHLQILKNKSRIIVNLYINSKQTIESTFFDLDQAAPLINNIKNDWLLHDEDSAVSIHKFN